ncbi:MAG TPA: zf-HC2 domain-containing protein [Anaerolineales bacterium]|nr:zf-HC2 domain-containing protein [Anaerolineales bacterium]
MAHENCRHLLGSLSEYIDGALGDEICTEIEKHLAGCENCRVVVDTLKKTVYLYHVTNENPAVPDGVRNRLLQRLELKDLVEK